jgi:hypothetical protein
MKPLKPALYNLGLYIMEENGEHIDGAKRSVAAFSRKTGGGGLASQSIKTPWKPRVSQPCLRKIFIF